MSIDIIKHDDLIVKEKKDWKWYRVERYRLQSIARGWFLEEGIKAYLKHPANFHKTAKCLCTRYKHDVEIVKSGDKAHYKNLVQCSHLWTCPVCASKIQSKRREEIRQFVEWVYKVKHQKCILITLTFPHYSSQLGEDILKRFTKALTYLKSGKSWQAFQKYCQVSGTVRGLEVTLGNNGWHIHTHDIWGISKQISLVYLMTIIIPRWEKACLRFGLLTAEHLDDFRQHSVDIIDNAHSSDYLAKSAWGIESEVANTHRKYGTGGITPFQMLDLGKRQEFLDYAKIFSDKRQLFWSKGLKAKVGIKDVSDSSCLEEEKSDILGTLSKNEWAIIVKNNVRVKVLEIAESQGILGVRKLLLELLPSFFSTQEKSENTEKI